MLIIFGGLPGVGKTTIARELASRLKAVYIRIDSIEQAIKSSHLEPDDMQDAGYNVAYKVAKDNLLLGHIVIADSVNPIEITRKDWQNTAKSIDKDFVEIEIICSDEEVHKNRLEGRTLDIEGLENPAWKKVQERDYHPWNLKGIQLDTATSNPSQNVEKIIEYIGKQNDKYL